MKKLFFLFIVLTLVMVVGCNVIPTQPPPTPIPIPTVDPLHKDVVVVRDPQTSGWVWDRFATTNNLPVFVYAFNPGTDNRIYFPLDTELNVHLTHDILTVESDGTIRAKDGLYYYCIANGVFPNGLSAAGYFVLAKHTKDIP